MKKEGFAKMTLQELLKDTDVNLDICFDEQRIEIPSRVVGTNEKGALIMPYIYQGHMIDFEVFKKRGAFFELYCTDPKTKIRHVFKNVNVTMVEYKNNYFYCISVHTMNRISYESDRRGDVRIPMTGTGYIVVEGVRSEKRISVDMHDISEKGIAIIAQETDVLPSGEFVVNVESMANDTSFFLNFHVQIVRKVEKPGWILYGCRFVHLDEDTLAYIYFRHLEENKYKKISPQNIL